MGWRGRGESEKCAAIIKLRVDSTRLHSWLRVGHIHVHVMNMTVQMVKDMDMDGMWHILAGGGAGGVGGGRLTLRVRRDGRTGSCAANGGHLIESLAMQLRLCDIGLEERDKQMLGQIQRRLAVQKGIQKASKAIEVNVLKGSKEKGV